MSDDPQPQIEPSTMPQFETNEKILNALKRSNMHSAKLIEIGYYLVGFMAILTVCVVPLCIILILAYFYR